MLVCVVREMEMGIFLLKDYKFDMIEVLIGGCCNYECVRVDHVCVSV